MRRTTAFPLLLVTLVLTSGAAAANPWQLHCRATPSEQPLPAPLREAALRFFPWVHPAAEGLRSGPVYLVALSTDTAVARDGDQTDSAGYYLHRALLAVAPGYPLTVVIHGRRLSATGPRTTLDFSTDGASRCTVKSPDVVCPPAPLTFAAALSIAPGHDWRIVPTEIRIGRTGCFQLAATGTRLRETIPLAVPGPDYGTAGW